MCGILALIGAEAVTDQEKIKPYFEALDHRGPDDSEWVRIDDHVLFGFKRRKIQGLDTESNEPLYLDSAVLVCNGEIYNYRELAEAHPDWKLQTRNDCEVILHLYRRYGIQKAVQMLDGEFSFVLYDRETGVVMATRDHQGVRPLYQGKYKGSTVFCSELYPMRFCTEINQLLPRHFLFAKPAEIQGHAFVKMYFRYPVTYLRDSEEVISAELDRLFRAAVLKRVHNTDVPFGFFLSGGWDSASVTAVAIDELKKEDPDFDPRSIRTFTTGMEGSPDLVYAREVAEDLGTTHTEFILTKEEMLDALRRTIRHAGTYDITTIRAMVPHLLLCEKIRDASDCIVMLSGELADELFGSYAYFVNAPSHTHLQKEILRLLRDVHHFDGLRGDRACAAASLELRLPFSDKEFLSYALRIPPSMKAFDAVKPEKAILRKIFGHLLPPSVRDRRKNGFSDSVSSKEDSWVKHLQNFVDTQVTEEEFLREAPKMNPNPPKLKEGYYYRRVFRDLMAPATEPGRHDKVCPYQWLPRWCEEEVIDPSAREALIGCLAD